MGVAVKQISIKQSENNYISKPIGADAEFVDIDPTHTLADKAPQWDGKAPVKHAVNNNTYGLSTENLYGHSKVVDVTDSRITDSAAAASAKSVYDGLANKVNLNMIADDFDSSKNYEVDEYVIYNSLLYKCKTNHLGSWDSTHFKQTTVSKEFGAGGTTLVRKPSVSIGTYTYNGSAQGPVISGLNENIVVSNATGVDAGTYTLTLSLRNTNTMYWNDLSNAPLTYEYTINKANQNLVASPENIVLNSDNANATVEITGAQTTLLVNSGYDSTIVTPSISNTTVVINGLRKTGNTSITIQAIENNNYKTGTVIIEIASSFDIPLVSWTTGTNAQITAMIEGYYNGDLTLDDIKSVWSLGDARTIHLSAMEAENGVEESHRAQDVEMVIIDFNKGQLKEPINPGTDKEIAAPLITINQKDCLMDSECADPSKLKYGMYNSEAGFMYSEDLPEEDRYWEKSERRAWCNDTYINAFPDYIKELNREVRHYKDNENYITDKAFLLSKNEIKRDPDAWNEVYEYYSYGNKEKNPEYKDSSISDIYYLRSDPDWINICYICDGSSSISSDSGTNYYGIAPAMCL